MIDWWAPGWAVNLQASINDLRNLVSQVNRKLDLVLTKESNVMVDLTKLTAEVQKNSDVAESVLALVNNLAAQIKAIPPSSDPTTQAALDALVATLSDNDQHLADAVVANTPAAE